MDALILEINTGGLNHYYPINSETTTIGRALDNDIILSDPTVAAHHLEIIRCAENSLKLVNQAEINPARVNGQQLDSTVTDQLPLSLTLGRIHARILSRNQEVERTRPIAGGSRSNHLFGHGIWVVILVVACLLFGGLEFYLNAYNIFKWGDLFKHVLRETVFTAGAFIVGLSVLERLLVNRWEIKQVITSVCLVVLLYYFSAVLADGLSYLVSANWPANLMHFVLNLILVPCAIALYLIHISHLKQAKAILLAILITSPIAIPAIMQGPVLRALLDDFSPSAKYHNNLSSLNWHLAETVSIESFIKQAGNLDAGEFAD
jgi:hypothetical protein